MAARHKAAHKAQKLLFAIGKVFGRVIALSPKSKRCFVKRKPLDSRLRDNECLLREYNYGSG